MNIKEYIESGTLEAYVLGSLTAKEAAQVEADIALYPELAKEMQAIEQAIFDMAGANAVEPPAGMDDKIWNSIQQKGNNAGAAESTTQNQPKIIPLQTEYRKPMQWRSAAVILALIGSLIVNLILWNQGRQQKEDKEALTAKMDQAQADQKQVAQLLDGYEKAKNMMADTAMQTIVMHTMQKGHPMAATLYWSKDKGEAYVAMDALPAPPKGMQYQLWVIQNGKPVDMGVLPNSMANTPAMQKVNMSITTGEAFAISLEKEGGNPTPTTVYVLGKA